MEKQAEHTCHGGKLAYYTHQAQSTSCVMSFTIFIPPGVSKTNPAPWLTFLSGLTCTPENFTTKAGAYGKAAELGLIIVAPDTSPRGVDVADADSYDLGQGASFYLDATETPWKQHYQMESYIIKDLNSLICQEFPVKPDKQGIFGHSMGGHGALTLFFKYPQLFKSVSAFAPIVAPMQCSWGEKAFSAYLGSDRATWKNYDASVLVENCSQARNNPEILIDQGLEDQFLVNQLKSEIFQKTCNRVGQSLNLRYQSGYDHSYFFIQSFIDDHLQHHYNFLVS